MSGRHEDIEDQLLVMDAQDRAPGAMDRLVERWQRRLWQHAARLTGDGQAAWDVTQQTWLAIIRGLHRLEDPARFRAWAYRIATNKAADWIRHRRAAPGQAGDDIAERPAPQAGDRDPTGVRELLGMLNAEKQVVLSLHYFDRLGIEEIGVALGLPAGTVKSRLHHARRELKELWQRHYGERRGETS